ncbi:MAG: hypothetical protein KF901_09805 [Myxococcales bacterium]|nr:hypothetical protein [Myxococcales bacterium]
MNDELSEALRTIHGSLERSPALAGAYYAHWRHPEPSPALDDAMRAAAELVDEHLAAWTVASDRQAFVAALGEPTAKVVLIWCDASSANQDARLATLLKVAASMEAWRDHARIVARNRVVEGPLVDALPCAPLLGPGEELGAPENREALARMEVLIWEAGARALEVPELGAWLWDRETTFEAVIGRPARGSLRGRVLAARCLEVAVRGMPMMTDPALVGRTLQVMQPLLLHPEPLVWIHAARAFGRLAGTFEPLEGTLLDWVHGATPVLRQRAMTAFASLPSSRLAFLGHELEAVIDSPENEAWVLAAAAAATPYLYHERRDLWDRLAARIMRGDGGAVAARALGRGLGTLWRRGPDREAIRAPFRKLRRRARRARADVVDDWRRWLELVSVTDPLDAAERDPLDVELGLENLVRVAAEYDDEEADARAARFASTLATTFTEARRVVLGEGSVRHRAAAMNAFEGCARSLALRLWDPLLATRPGERAEPVDEPELEETWNLVARAPAELLEIVRTRREASEGDDDEAFTLALEVLAIKLGGYALDACGG